MAITFYDPFYGPQELKFSPEVDTYKSFKGFEDKYKGYEISAGSIVNPNTHLEAVGSIVHTKSQKTIKVKLGEPDWDTFASFIKTARAVIDLTEEVNLFEEFSKKQTIFTPAPAFDSSEVLKEEELSEEDTTLEHLEEKEQDLLEDLQDYESEAKRNRLEEFRTRIHAARTFEGYTDNTEDSSKEEIKPTSSLDSWFESTDTKRWL